MRLYCLSVLAHSNWYSILYVLTVVNIIYIYVIPRSVATIVPLFLKPFLSGRCAFAPFHHHFTYKCYIDITNEYTHRLCPSLDRLHAMCYTNIRTYMYICGRHMIPINIFHCFCQKSKTFHVVIRTSDDVVIMLVFLPFYFFLQFFAYCLVQHIGSSLWIQIYRIYTCYALVFRRYWDMWFIS